MKSALLTTILALAASTALAGESVYFKRCMQRSDYKTLEVLECIHSETVFQETRLNSLYGQALRKLNPEGRTRLNAEQMAWFTYRDSVCDMYFRRDLHGTDLVMNSNDCVMRKTIARADELETY